MNQGKERITSPGTPRTSCAGLATLRSAPRAGSVKALDILELVHTMYA